MENLDFQASLPLSKTITESASHHVGKPLGTPRNTAHMRQHGKFEYLKAKNRPENAIYEKFQGFRNILIFYHF